MQFKDSDIAKMAQREVKASPEALAKLKREKEEQEHKRKEEERRRREQDSRR